MDRQKQSKSRSFDSLRSLRRSIQIHCATNGDNCLQTAGSFRGQMSMSGLSGSREAGVVERVTCGTGYPFDSGSPNRLWFGLFPFDGRVNDLPVSSWLDCDGLLHKSVEEFASAARFAAVEAEREFV